MNEQSKQGKFYITTPLYYPSDKLHIGHSYTTVAVDVISRYKRLRGYDVRFLTGTDEHGQKMERVAQANNMTPQEYVDHIVAGIKELWKLMDIDYDAFIRTTSDKHVTAVQKIFRKLYDQGDIYKGSYEGWYCTPDEAFFTEHQLVDGKCPDCGRDVEKVREESYFFKLSKYQQRLIDHIESNPQFIMPQSRRNEMINNFLKPGLEDLCVSRTSFKWGIPVEFDAGHVVYVWIDALSGYITELGCMSGDDTLYKKYWPADIQVVGKEIVRFHTIIWPAMLMALNEPLPAQVFGHGWLIIDGGKMSKSKGTVVDPKILVERYGVDAIRYFLMREVAFGQDGNYTNEAFIQRINSDLANDLGNLVSRTVGMIDKYFGGKLPVEQQETVFDADLKKLAVSTVGKVEAAFDNLMFSDALNEIWNLVRRTNKYTDETQPWVLIKDAEKRAQLAGVMYNLAETLRIVSILISPFMPNTPKPIHAQLNMDDAGILDWESTRTFGLLPAEVKITKGDIIFPRIDMKKELDDLAGALQPDEAPEKGAANKQEKKPESKSEKQAAQEPGKPKQITIDDFGKIELKTGKVMACEKVEGSDKLLKSQVKVGGELRTIVSGIANYYSPEQMVGKTVVIVTNLKPVKLRGILSEGMLLAASDDDGKLNIVTVDGDIGDGAEVR